MTRYKCTVAYCGADYSGWQKQPDHNSIQDYIEDILNEVSGEKISIIGSGRTDAKVNAWGQVFHFDSDMLSARRWRGVLNSRLPDDIHIRDIIPAGPYFHARSQVKRKRYEYHINRGEYNVFTKDTAYQCPYEIDTEAMKEASRILIGTHDFTSFNSTPLSEIPDQVRTIQAIEFTENGDELVISFLGKGFLRYMVRMISGELLEVGRGRKTADDIRSLLEKKEKDIAKHNARPQGLTLKEVEYYDVAAVSQHYMVREAIIEDNVLPEKDLFVLTPRYGKDVLALFRKGEISLPEGLGNEETDLLFEAAALHWKQKEGGDSGSRE